MSRAGGTCLARKGLPVVPVLGVADRSAVIGYKESGESEAIVHGTGLRRSREDAVAGIVEIIAKTVLDVHFLIGLGHHLHELHSSRARGDRAVGKGAPPAAFRLHDGADPGLGEIEPRGGIGDEGLPAIDPAFDGGEWFGKAGPGGGRKSERSDNRRITWSVAARALR